MYVYVSCVLVYMYTSIRVYVFIYMYLWTVARCMSTQPKKGFISIAMYMYTVSRLELIIKICLTWLQRNTNRIGSVKQGWKIVPSDLGKGFELG